MRRLGTLFLAGLAALTAVETGAAATAHVTDSFGLVTVEYVAAPGEANALTISGGFASPNGPATVRFQDTGAAITPLASCAAGSPNDVTCTVWSFDTLIVRVVVGDLDDSVTFSPTSSRELLTDMFGGDGNDTLTGGPGSELFTTDAGSDVMNGGGGFDLVSYFERFAGVRVSIDGLANDGEVGEGDLVGEGIEVVIGGRGDDVFIGGPRSDTFDGAEGNDALRGAGGPDFLLGSSGDDLLVGGPGADRALGGRGDDRFFMKDRTRDRINGGRGRDRARIDPRLDRPTGVEALVA